MSENKTCLVIDDSDVIREIAARIAVDLGLETQQADAAVAAISICEAGKIDVVLLDWDLPSMGALDFLRGAAELPVENRPAIILCATENDHQQFLLAKAAGAAHHILKPFDRSAVEAVFVTAGILDGAVSVPDITSIKA